MDPIETQVQSIINALERARIPITLFDLAAMIQMMGVPLDGSVTPHMAHRPNSHLLPPVSPAFAAIFAELVIHPDVVIARCKPELYYRQGFRPVLPVGSRIGGRDYPMPHWVPVTIQYKRSGNRFVSQKDVAP